MASPKKKLKMFHASVAVTRIEDWCVEAETEQQAREMLAGRQGERLAIGDCVYLEVAALSD